MLPGPEVVSSTITTSRIPTTGELVPGPGGGGDGPGGAGYGAGCDGAEGKQEVITTQTPLHQEYLWSWYEVSSKWEDFLQSHGSGRYRESHYKHTIP